MSYFWFGRLGWRTYPKRNPGRFLMPWRLSSASSLVSKLWVVSISTMALLQSKRRAGCFKPRAAFRKTSLWFSGCDLLRVFGCELAAIETAGVGVGDVAAGVFV